MMEKRTFCRFVFVFLKRKTKQQVSGSSFWFENEIVDVVLSNRFRKQNETKRKFPFTSKTKRNDNKKIKTCPTLPIVCFRYTYSMF